MLQTFKNNCPILYEYYKHILRCKNIYEINRLKKFTIQQKKAMISDMYLERIGRPLEWDNPKAYTEKMQLEKLNTNSLKTLLTDKYLVREWVKEKIGAEYLIPILGVWDNFKDICFDDLPNQFVLKTNHGSGTNLIVRDKNKLNKKIAKIKFNDWMKLDYAYLTGFEMHYSDIKRKIIAEEYLETSLGELQDYKFLCFDGRPYFCWVDLGRYSKHTRTVFDLNWNVQPWTQANYNIYKDPIPKPQSFGKMIEIATELCKDFTHVRVDLYNVEGEIYFGEMTFTNGSGFDPIIPDEYDYMLGDLWTLK